MNEQTQSAFGSLSSQIILDDFFDLIASKDVTTLLNRALQVLRRNLQATAGSIFFFTTPAQFIKSGDCPQAVWNHIDHLETTVMERLHGGIWRVIEKDLPPVSIHKFGHENLTVMNTPLLQTTKVVGSLSVVFLESRRPSLAQRATLTQLARGIGQLAVTVAEHALTEKRYRELDLIYKMGQAMVSTLNIHQFLDDVMRLFANVLGAIIVQYLKDDVVFEVKDDGRGFDVSHIQSHYVSRTSLGLIHMKERAELIEGVLTFDSKTDGADSGTTVTLAVPTKSSTKPLKNLILRKQMNYES